VSDAFRQAFASYRETLAPAYQSLLDRYELRDTAIKVVGIGSVGTVCWVFLLTAGDGDPLFLQAKQARASVLERHAGPSGFANEGQRVVNGYRILQPASDIFLGWSLGVPPTGGTTSSASCATSRSASGWRPSVPPKWTSTPPGAAGPSPCRMPGRFLHPPERVHGQERYLRRGDRRLRHGLRRPERAGPRELDRAVRLGKVPAVFEDAR